MAREEFAQKGDRVIINDGMSSVKDGPFFVVLKREPNHLWLRPELGHGDAFRIDLHGVSKV